MFIVSVDDKGAPNGQFQADTLAGDQESPKELGAKPGKGTAGLGVSQDGKLLNAADGSLPALGSGKHRLVLYVAPSSSLAAGTRLRVYAQRPDKSVVSGATLSH